MDSPPEERDNPKGTPLLSWPNVFLIVATVAVLAGVFVLIFRPDSSPGVEISLPTPTPYPQLKVYVSGAVVQPGVYEFHDGDRLQNVLHSAGGFLPSADASAVNLASLLEDEQHYHFPTVSESRDAQSNSANDAESEDETSTAELPTPTPDNPIDINAASQQELQSLPGIGEVKAHAIIDFRNAHGPFAEASEITGVPGIGPIILENIQHLITASAAAP